MKTRVLFPVWLPTFCSRGFETFKITRKRRFLEEINRKLDNMRLDAEIDGAELLCKLKMIGCGTVITRLKGFWFPVEKLPPICRAKISIVARWRPNFNFTPVLFKIQDLHVLTVPSRQLLKTNVDKRLPERVRLISFDKLPICKPSFFFKFLPMIAKVKVNFFINLT